MYSCSMLVQVKEYVLRNTVATQLPGNPRYATAEAMPPYIVQYLEITLTQIA